MQKQLPTPFVVYAEFESTLKPENEDVDVTQGVEAGIESSSHVFQEQGPCSSAYKIISGVDPEFSRPLIMYSGDDAAEMLVRKLQLTKQLLDEYIATPKPMLLATIHCYTTPGLAWDTALRMSHIDLQLITDNDMYNFVENNIRGGISMISTRHAQANTPSFPAT